MPTTSERMLALLSLLQTRRDWPGGVLAERLGVTPRTVRRDVDRLRELGYRVDSFKGPDGGYRLEAGSELPPLLLDDDQALALAVSLTATATSGAGLGDDVREAAERALLTVRQVMPARLRRRLDVLPMTAVSPGSAASEHADPEVLVQVGAAVQAREVLRLDYASPGAEVARRRVEPHHLVSWRQRWYLVAWDLDREDWRTLRLDRIAPRVPTGPRFAKREVPGGDVAAFVTARFRGSTESTAWPCEGEAVLALPIERVRPFAGDATLEVVDDGRTRIRLGAWSWPAVAASLARFDADLSEVEPAELRAAFGELAERSARAARG